MADDSRKFKVVFIGDSTVGKTSLIHNFLKQDVKPTSTLGATSTRVETKIEGQTLILNVWDTAGQDSFRNLVPVYAKGSHAAVIVFDQTNEKSFEHVKDWYDYMMEHVGQIIMVLAANKNDLICEVDFNQVYRWAADHKIEVVRTSATEGTNVDILFETVSKELFKLSQEVKEEKPQAVDIVEEVPQKEKKDQKNKSGCCK